MMKRYAILGLGAFGRAVVEEMLQKQVELVIADQDEKAVEDYKDQVMAVFVADLMSKPTLEQIMPRNLDGCVIDFGDNTEASLLVTHYLHQMGQENIMVLGRSASHAEILRLLGASTVVHPAREAARRMVPRLLNNGLLSYTPLGRGLSFAEILLPAALVGVPLREARFRERFNLNVIAARTDDQAVLAAGRSGSSPAAAKPGVEAAPGAGDDILDGSQAEQYQYRTLNADYVFRDTDILLVSGSDAAIGSYGSRDEHSGAERPAGFMRRLFKKK